MAVLNLSDKMPAEEESDEVEMESESGEEGVVLHKLKYRELKSRLKYLVYVSSHLHRLLFTDVYYNIAVQRAWGRVSWITPLFAFHASGAREFSD